MRAKQLSNGDIQVTMSEAEAISIHRDIEDGNVGTSALDRLGDELADVIEVDEDEDDEDLDEESEDIEGTEDDDEEISS